MKYLKFKIKIYGIEMKNTVSNPNLVLQNLLRKLSINKYMLQCAQIKAYMCEYV